MELRGCGDHGCIIKKPTGQGTNGGCRCIGRHMDTRNILEVKQLIHGLKQARSELSKEIAERLHDSLGDLCNKYEIYSSDDQFWIFHKVIGSGEPLKQWIENSIKELQSNG